MNTLELKRRRRSSGQAITEYAACLAFAACVIALAFNLAQGSLFTGVSQSFSSLCSAFYNLNETARNNNVSK